jgi:hypothetical protein
LKHLHPRISNYNDLLTFLIWSNTDIKYIGSGEAAKALVFYITDYITKSELPVHEGLGAIQAAVEKTENQYDSESISSGTWSRSLLIKSLNAIMGRTELSHQQVMSYLLGGGDVYTSHMFQTVIWSDVEQYLGFTDAIESRLEADVSPLPIHSESSGLMTSPDHIIAEPEGVFRGEEMVSIDLDAGKKISASNIVRDYAFHDEKFEFERLCLYEYIARGYKTKDPGRAGIECVRASLDKIGRFGKGHQQRATHIVRLRNEGEGVVPVILGHRFPRSDGGKAEKEEWCQSMLALFKP